ncbi:MAG: hypothetical protein ACTSR5_15090, partial [Promethearchaeota archaeon]
MTKKKSFIREFILDIIFTSFLILMIIREFSEDDTDEITSLMKQLCLLKGKDFNEERWRKSLTERMFTDSQSKVIVAFDEKSNP